MISGSRKIVLKAPCINYVIGDGASGRSIAQIHLTFLLFEHKNTRKVGSNRLRRGGKAEGMEE